MDKFQIIQPSALLAPYVKQYWFLTRESSVKSSQRLVPFGCTALTFHRGNLTYSSLDQAYLPQTHLYGVTKTHTDLVFSGYINFLCIIFQPAGARLFFTFPLNELNSSYLPVDLLNDPELNKLEQQVYETQDNLQCVNFIEQFLLRRMYRFNPYNDERINTAINTIYKGEANVDNLASTVCLGYKQFKRVFTEHIGINPKDFLQIVRFQRLHHLLQKHTPMPVSELAYECGYYDKSHLIKELKQLSGFTPTELTKACDSVYSTYHALFRSAFINLLPE